MRSSVKPGPTTRTPAKSASPAAPVPRVAWVDTGDPNGQLTQLLRDCLGNEVLWLQPEDKSLEQVDALLIAMESMSDERVARPESSKGVDDAKLSSFEDSGPADHDIPAAVVQRLQEAIRRNAADCEPGGLPVFLVLADAERLARPGDTAGAWLQRIETAKLRTDQQLREALPGHRGFGSFHVRVWAVALERPPLKEDAGEKDPLGVVELARDVLGEARAYRARRTRQPWRLQFLVWCLLALLAGMIGLAAWLLAERLWPSAPSAADEQPDVLTLARELLTRGERLRRFDGVNKPREASIDWPRWHAEATSFREQLRALGRPRLPAPQNDRAFAQTLARLKQIERDLEIVRERAEVFQLAGKVSTRPGVLHIPPGFTIDQARSRLEDLRRHYPDFHPDASSAMPGVVPLAAARDLAEAARANYEKLLEPARRVVANRLKEISPGGGETAEAWKKLAAGWLTRQAEQELADWSELARLLHPAHADPLTELQTFLRQTSFDLPLGTIELRLPDTLSSNGNTLTSRRSSGPLVLRYQPPQGKEVMHVLVAREPRLPGEPSVFVNERPRLLFEPGGRLTAQVGLVDPDGRRWLLTWPAAEARSAVYSFQVLTQAPRLHAEAMTDPARGTLAFDVRLLLLQPELFELPDLFPR